MLALVYIVAVSLIVAALSTWAVNDLNNTGKFDFVTSLHTAATNAMDVAIQSIRYYPIPSANPIPAGSETYTSPSPTYCWTPTSGSVSDLVSTINGRSFDIAVWCSTSENLLSNQTRVVSLYACINTGLSSCSPLLNAVVNIDDYQQGGDPTLSQQCTATCGQGLQIASWTWVGGSTTLPSTTTTSVPTTTTTTTTTTVPPTTTTSTTSTTSTTTTTVVTTGTYTGSTNTSNVTSGNYYAINSVSSTSSSSSTGIGSLLSATTQTTITSLTFNLGSSSGTTFTATVGYYPSGGSYVATAMACSVTAGTTQCLSPGGTTVVVPAGDYVNIQIVGNSSRTANWTGGYHQP